MNLVTANAVIAARSFNPSILSQLWLVRNNVVSEEDFGNAPLFADGVSQVETSRLMLLALPDRLQIAPKDAMDQDSVQNAISRIVTALPHTPYTALGLNFVWHHEPEGESMAQLTRRLFYRDGCQLYDHFVEQDSHFGAYLSKAYGMMRLKLDIKPIIIQTPQGESHNRLQFGFNFHQDLGSDAVERIHEALGGWTENFNLAHRIAGESVGANVDDTLNTAGK